MNAIHRLLPLFGVLLFTPALTAQTPDMIAEVEAKLHALRTAAPAILPGPGATVAIEEASTAALAARIDVSDLKWP